MNAVRISWAAAVVLAAMAIGCGSNDVSGTWCSKSASEDEACTGAVFAEFDQRDDVVTGKVCQSGFDQACALIGDGRLVEDTLTFEIPNQDGRHEATLTLSDDDLSGKVQTCACETSPCTCVQALSLHRIN